MSKKEVIKHSAAIQVTNTISLLQRRMWNVMLANAYDDLPVKDKYEIKISELEKILSFDRRNKKYLKETLETLVGCRVKYNVLEKDGEEWTTITTLLAQAKFNSNKIVYAYAPELRERLYNPAMYARISLSMQNKFDSKYALGLYELFIDYYDISRSYGETPWIDVIRFRSLMGVGENEYQEFRFLKKRAIEDPIKEINTKSDLTIEPEYKKLSRTVTHVKFKIFKKPEALLLPAKSNDDPDLFTVTAANKLEAFGISRHKTEELINRYDQVLVEQWMDCLNGNYIKDVSNKPGYLVAALEKGFDFPPAYTNHMNQKKTVDIQKEREERKKNCPICKGEGGRMEETVIDGRNYTYWKDCQCIKGT